MYLLCGMETKLLATALAVMTVVTGLPRVQCVCPDGRVHFFCAGPSTPQCCCAGHVPGAGHQSGETDCCARATRGTPAGDGAARAGSGCGCERTVVAAPPQYAPVDDGAASRGDLDAPLGWGPAAVLPEHPVRLTRVQSEAHRHPPDLVVLLCHFTC